MAFNIRQAKPQDVGEIAYMILQWATDELPAAVRFIEPTAFQAERTARIVVFDPGYYTKVAEDNQVIVGIYIIATYPEGAFGDEPYGSLLGIYVKPEHRGHRLLGFGLLQDANREAQKMGLAFLYINPMVKSKNFAAILTRLGYAPLCVSHMKRF